MRGRLFAATVAVLGMAGATLAGTGMAGGDPSPPTNNSSFVAGDLSAVGQSVEFWGAQWAKDNQVSGGNAPDAFKGFADVTTATGMCSGTFSTLPGNSSGPPAALDSSGVQAVLVAYSVTKSGRVISGTYTDIAYVQYDPGYGPDPGHAGTGTVLGLCTQGATSTNPTGGSSNDGGEGGFSS